MNEDILRFTAMKDDSDGNKIGFVYDYIREYEPTGINEIGFITVEALFLISLSELMISFTMYNKVNDVNIDIEASSTLSSFCMLFLISLSTYNYEKCQCSIIKYIYNESNKYNLEEIMDNAIKKSNCNNIFTC